MLSNIGKASRISFVNNEFLPHQNCMVHIEDRGFQFADGVYEVILFKNNKLIDADAHLSRLDRSLSGLKIIIWPPFSKICLKFCHFFLIRMEFLVFCQIFASKNTVLLTIYLYSLILFFLFLFDIF